MAIGKDYQNSSATEQGFKRKLRMIEGESFTPPFDTLGFDQPILGMDDLDRMRKMKLKKYTK